MGLKIETGGWPATSTGPIPAFPSGEKPCGPQGHGSNKTVKKKLNETKPTRNEFKRRQVFTKQHQPMRKNKPAQDALKKRDITSPIRRRGNFGDIPAASRPLIIKALNFE